MAARLGRAFGANPQELLNIQAKFDHFQQRSLAPKKLPVGAYVPPFLGSVDFPGYDQEERKGWDGRADADAAT